MKIQIIDEENILEITDDGFNVDNFISLTFHGNSMDVPTEELYSAAKAFYDMRISRRKADKLL